MEVFVRDNDVNAALRVLKKKMQREGTFREMKLRRSYEKPSERGSCAALPRSRRASAPVSNPSEGIWRAA
jgi:small subunit ribosomal protein S21